MSTIDKNTPNLPKLGLVTFVARPNAPISDKRGVRSMIVAEAKLPIQTCVGTFALIASLWARLSPTSDGMEFAISASLPGGRFPVLECDSAETEDGLIQHIERCAQRWSGFNAVYDAAQDRLTGKTGIRRGIQRQPEKPASQLVKTAGMRVPQPAAADGAAATA
jgi:hypothetical protein